MPKGWILRPSILRLNWNYSMSLPLWDVFCKVCVMLVTLWHVSMTLWHMSVLCPVTLWRVSMAVWYVPVLSLVTLWHVPVACLVTLWHTSVILWHVFIKVFVVCCDSVTRVCDSVTYFKFCNLTHVLRFALCFVFQEVDPDKQPTQLMYVVCSAYAWWSLLTLTLCFWLSMYNVLNKWGTVQDREV